MPVDTCMTPNGATPRQNHDRSGAPSFEPADEGPFGEDPSYTHARHIRLECHYISCTTGEPLDLLRDVSLSPSEVTGDDFHAASLCMLYRPCPAPSGFWHLGI